MSAARSPIGRIAMLAGLLLVAAGAGFVSAASCSGSSCNGKNPQTMGCSLDAVTKGHVHSEDQLTVAIRYSPACDAWWARVTCNRPDPTATVYVNIIQITNGAQSSKQRLVGDHRVGCDRGETTWTYMITDRAKGDHYNACWAWGFYATVQSPTESNSRNCVGRF